MPSEQQLSAAYDMIKYLGTCPSEQLMDNYYTQQCRDYDGDDPVRFLLDLRDDLVYSGGCANAVLIILSAALDATPETDEEKRIRRTALEKRRGERT